MLFFDHEPGAGGPPGEPNLHQQNMQAASVWGNVAASFLGAAAGAAISHSWSHSYDSCSTYDSGEVWRRLKAETEGGD